MSGGRLAREAGARRRRAPSRASPRASRCTPASPRRAPVRARRCTRRREARLPGSPRRPPAVASSTRIARHPELVARGRDVVRVARRRRPSRTTRPRFGSTRASRPSTWSATHRPPGPAARPAGARPTTTRSTTRFVAGSTRRTTSSSGALTQREPPANAIPRGATGSFTTAVRRAVRRDAEHPPVGRVADDPDRARTRRHRAEALTHVRGRRRLEVPELHESALRDPVGLDPELLDVRAPRRPQPELGRGRHAAGENRDAVGPSCR